MDEKKKKFLQRFDGIKDLPALPAIVARVNQMLDDPNTHIDLLCRVIETDQAIVFKMLRLVNSAFFGLRETVSTTNEAAIVLGFDAIRNIVVSLSAFTALNNLSRQNALEEFKLEAFWRHSIGVAVLSKYLADKSGAGNPEKCFVAGLLHDMGKLILACFFTDDFRKVIAAARENSLLYQDAEKMILPLQHSELAYYVTRKWNIPAHLSHAIYAHHGVKIGAAGFEDSIIVNTADGIINSYTADFLNNNTKPGKLIYRYFDPWSAKRMRLWIESSAKWFPGVKLLIDEARTLLME